MWFILLRPRVADLIAATGRCAACGYDLTATPPEADGLSVCPECGGAWRVREPSPPA